ncbi:MAG: DUF1700 domain-containing protein [Ruminococcaceae bacterium]|nr:DUF1700 domain-containing protein [Oscillospiraceae bacterium]
MNKIQFIAELKNRLSSLPPCDINKFIDYYSEMIDDRIEDGLSEEEAVNDLGNIENIVSQIFSEYPEKTEVYSPAEKTVSSGKKLSSSWIVLIAVLTSPIWIPLISSAASVVFSVIISVAAIMIVLYALDFAFAVCGITSVVASIPLLLQLEVFQSGMCFGLGLICIGLSILLFFGANWFTKQTVKFFKYIFRKTNELFKKRGAAA